MPPRADAATIQPTTSGLMPLALSTSAVNGKVLPAPMPSTATLKVTAVKSRQRSRSSIAGSTRESGRLRLYEQQMFIF